MIWEIIAVVLFWLVYGPFSLAILLPKNSSELVLILGIGVILTIIFLAGRLLFFNLKRKPKTIQVKQEAKEIKPELLLKVFEENFGHHDLN